MDTWIQMVCTLGARYPMFGAVLTTAQHCIVSGKGNVLNAGYCWFRRVRRKVDGLVDVPYLLGKDLTGFLVWITGMM
jgi:hypothetical protein